MLLSLRSSFPGKPLLGGSSSFGHHRWYKFFSSTPQITPHGEARLERVDVPKGLRDVRANAELSSGLPYTTIVDPFAITFAERLIYTQTPEATV
ncbi:uncharacterized protein N7473_012987 [Penicillium subrubescens]|uniref:uncharacterized protein n=1 Tax=Penicillium subrubescens TaxID=1316194 RepID=UPI002544FA96|nr:uncharacterized protein N7473_012987 [Penicillium subrubescens]KAJ5875640.1 hypothetical protein N7473_012987 [Penicillium subrubescens]